MPRIKEREKILHQPSTHEILLCLSDMKSYSEILLKNSAPKDYSAFLEWMIQMNFFNASDEKRSITKIATDFKAKSSKVTKWIAAIYEDIITLNYDKPHLFQHEGINVNLNFRHFDDFCSFNTSLPVLPREFERFQFYFIKAKTGANAFWVKEVIHYLEEDTFRIEVMLEAGSGNKYREFVIDKALFHGEIGFMDVFRSESFELDEKLKRIYRR